MILHISKAFCLSFYVFAAQFVQSSINNDQSSSVSCEKRSFCSHISILLRYKTIWTHASNHWTGKCTRWCKETKRRHDAFKQKCIFSLNHRLKSDMNHFRRKLARDLIRFKTQSKVFYWIECVRAGFFFLFSCIINTKWRRRCAWCSEAYTEKWTNQTSSKSNLTTTTTTTYPTKVCWFVCLLICYLICLLLCIFLFVFGRNELRWGSPFV